MEAFQQRVVEEKDVLDSKIEKSHKFLSDKPGDLITIEELHRMQYQCDLMKRYCISL